MFSICTFFCSFFLICSPSLDPVLKTVNENGASTMGAEAQILSISLFMAFPFVPWLMPQSRIVRVVEEKYLKASSSPSLSRLGGQSTLS